jgi:mycofactocin precursor
MTEPRNTLNDQAEPELVAEDLIVEVSIDGMCGVY